MKDKEKKAKEMKQYKERQERKQAQLERQTEMITAYSVRTTESLYCDDCKLRIGIFHYRLPADFFEKQKAKHGDARRIILCIECGSKRVKG